MLRLILLCVTLAMVGSSCQKEVFDRLENRLEGTWYFTKAKHRPIDNFGAFESVLERYSGDEITFRDDQTVLYKESSGDQYEGVWDLHAVSNEEVQYILSFAIDDNNQGIVQYVWETNGLWGDHCLTVMGTTSNYEFQYDLKKR